MFGASLRSAQVREARKCARRCCASTTCTGQLTSRREIWDARAGSAGLCAPTSSRAKAGSQLPHVVTSLMVASDDEREDWRDLLAGVVPGWNASKQSQQGKSQSAAVRTYGIRQAACTFPERRGQAGLTDFGWPAGESEFIAVLVCVGVRRLERAARTWKSPHMRRRSTFGEPSGARACASSIVA